MTDGDRLTLGDLDVDAVWLKSSGANPSDVVHPDPDCHLLRSARRVIGPKDPAVLDDEKLVCLYCLDEMPAPNRDGPGGVWQMLEALDADELATDGGRELNG